MPMLDIFRNNAFGLVELTDAINVVPNKYGTLQAMNIFPGRGIIGHTVSIEIQNNVLNVLPSVPRGGPASKGSMGKRTLQALEVPHFPHEDSVLADEVAGVRKFGTEADLESVQELVNDKLEVMSGKHDVTLELLRWMALKGIIADPVTGDLLVNLFTFFNVVQEVQNWALDVPETEMKIKANELKRYMEANLFGETMSYIQVFAGPGFMDAFTTHPTVKEAYDRYQSSQEPLRTDVRAGFNWQGIIFKETVGNAVTVDGTVIEFVDDDEAIAIPMGTTNVFKTYFGSANFIETVNQRGVPRYAKQKTMKWDEGIDIHTQSNPLPICLRPNLLVKLTRA